MDVPVSTVAEEHRRVCGCRLCSQRDQLLRSTSGVAEYYGRAPIEFASSTQSVRALNTGKAEFYAITKGSAHSLHSQAILKGFRGDGGSSGPVGRECWHWDCIAPRFKWLWVQEKVSEKALRLRKHPTDTNTADLATKYLTLRMEMLAAGNLVLSGEGERMVRTS